MSDVCNTQAYRKAILRPVLTYAFFAALWILVSDRAAGWLARDPDLLVLIGTFKGWVFVAVTSLLLYGLLRRSWRRSIGGLSERVRALTLLESIAEGSEDAIFAKDANGRYLFFNSAASRFVGKPSADVLGRDARALFPPNQAERLMAVDRRVMDQDQSVIAEETLDTPAGKRVFLSTRGALRDADGAVFGIFGVSRDITERKLAEEALQESKDQFRRVVENSPLSMALVSSDGVIEYINLKAIDTFGYLPQDIPNMDRWWVQAYPDKTYRDEVMAQWMGLVGAALAHNREIEQREYRVTCKDGSVKIVAIFGVWIANKVLVIFEDITERKRAQEALRESDEKFAAAFNSAPVMITISDVETGTYLDVNQQFTTFSGFSRGEAIGKTSIELGWLDPVDRTRVLELIRREGKVEDLELVLHAKSGKEVICRYWGERITVSGKERLLSVALDITDHRSIEQQLRQAQKMEAIGTLAGGIAHDFNNLLTVILGNCEMVGRGAPPEDNVARCIGLIREAGERAASLVQQLLAFGRKQILQPQLLNLAELVEDGVRMLGRLLREDVEICVCPSPNTGLVKVDPGQLQQIVLNLALNARDAMPSGGKLTIETGNVYCDMTDVVRHPGLKPGLYEVLSVSDTGHGMDAPTLARIFEPFFTTKEFGKGSGLGLATVHGIVNQSGGHIEVVSNVGQGSTFRLYFPSAKPETGSSTAGPPAKEAPKGTETVLVTEDAPEVRELASRILRELGYRVLEASGGEEALGVAGGEQGTLHLLLTDVVMPGMSGRVLADRLTAKRPGIKVLYMSGYTDDVLAHHAVRDRGLQFIQKPFRLNDLALKVRQVLDDPPATA